MKRTFHRIAALLLFFFVLPSAHAFTLTTQPNQWYLISLPGDSGQSLAEFFDGTLNPEEFSTSWSVFPFDEQDQDYEVVTANSRLAPGEAFWFLHMEDGVIDLEVDMGVTTVPLTLADGCSSPIGCFEFDLPAGSTDQYSLLGAPFPEGVSFRDVVLVTSGGDCESGCSVQEATAAGLTNGELIGFNEGSNSYQNPLQASEYLEVGEGYWLTTSIPANLAPAYLLLPTFCTPFS